MLDICGLLLALYRYVHAVSVYVVKSMVGVEANASQDCHLSKVFHPDIGHHSCLATTSRRSPSKRRSPFWPGRPTKKRPTETIAGEMGRPVLAVLFDVDGMMLDTGGLHLSIHKHSCSAVRAT
jgi:hypothetical protein